MTTNHFDKGPQGWCSYDYHWSVVSGGENVFILSNWAASGGVRDSGYIWTDESRWSADTPESPVSVLPFLLYRSWVDADPLDLRGARLSVYLRGDDLQLGDAQCYFWAHSPSCRWHMGGRPFSISDGRWADTPNEVALDVDGSVWYRSWSLDSSHERSLEEVLSDTHSFGISLVGFGQEPRGKLSMDEFRLDIRAG